MMSIFAVEKMAIWRSVTGFGYCTILFSGADGVVGMHLSLSDNAWSLIAASLHERVSNSQRGLSQPFATAFIYFVEAIIDEVSK
jgi:hypothetical protein